MTNLRPFTPDSGGNRRGIAGVWLLLSIPLFVAVLGFVLNIGFLWIAEANLENAAAAGALAGAEVLSEKRGQDSFRSVKTSSPLATTEKSPDPFSPDEDAVAAAAEFIKANGGTGRKSSLKTRSGKHSQSHGCRSIVLLGTVDGRTFRPSQNRKHKDACYVQLSCKVDGPLGWLTGPKSLRVSATAVVSRDGRTKLVEIDRVRRDD